MDDYVHSSRAETEPLLAPPLDFPDSTVVKLYLKNTKQLYWHLHLMSVWLHFFPQRSKKRSCSYLHQRQPGGHWRLFADEASALKHHDITCSFTRTADTFCWEGSFPTTKFRLTLQASLACVIETYRDKNWMVLHRLRGELFRLVPIQGRPNNGDLVYVGKGKYKGSFAGWKCWSPNYTQASLNIGGQTASLSSDYVFILQPYEKPIPTYEPNQATTEDPPLASVNDTPDTVATSATPVPFNALLAGRILSNMSEHELMNTLEANPELYHRLEKVMKKLSRGKDC